MSTYPFRNCILYLGADINRLKVQCCPISPHPMKYDIRFLSDSADGRVYSLIKSDSVSFLGFYPITH